MIPGAPSQGKKITAPDNIYTVILAVAFFAVLATAIFVAYQCYSRYETIFSIQ